MQLVLKQVMYSILTPQINTDNTVFIIPSRREQNIGIISIFILKKILLCLQGMLFKTVLI